MRSSVSNLPDSSRSGSRTTMSPPMPAACVSHSARIAGEARAAIPLREARHHGARERAEQRRPASPRRRAPRDSSPDRPVPCGMMRAVHADADRDRGRLPPIALRLDQDAGELRAVEQQVVRPFELERRLQAAALPRRPHRAPPAPPRSTAPADARPAPDRSAAGWRRDCPAPRSRHCRAGRARRSGAPPSTHSGPRSPARARASASALVEPSVSWR